MAAEFAPEFAPERQSLAIDPFLRSAAGAAVGSVPFAELQAPFELPVVLVATLPT